MKRLSLCLLLAAFAVAAAAQPAARPAARTLTPEEAVSLGLAHSRTLDAVAQQAAEAEAGYHAARTQRLPALGGQGSYQRLSPNVPGFEVGLGAVPGAPAADEIVFFLAMSTGARVHERVGGLRADAIEGVDGLR